MDEPTLRVGPSYDGSAIAIDLVVIGVLAVLFTFVLQRALRSGALAHLPKPPKAADESPEARALRDRSRSYLLLVIISSLLGLGLLVGPMVWLRGRRLCQFYRSQGWRPPWMATAASVTGAAVVVAIVVAVLGLVLIGAP